MSTDAPRLEDRSARDWVEIFERRAPAFLPGWRVSEGGAGTAVATIFGHFLESLSAGLNGAPDKNKLAHLDRLGVDQLSAVPARAPVVFEPLPGLAAADAPIRTRLSANAGDGSPLVFETEAGVAVVTAPLAEVRTVLPSGDRITDHTTDVLGIVSTRLFAGGTPIDHHLYLSHPVHFALAGNSELELDIRLTAASDEALPTSWEFWDGKQWRPFGNDSVDGTAEWTAPTGGMVTLLNDCGVAQPTTVDGVEGHWIRAALRGPLPPDSLRQLPEISRVRVRSTATLGVQFDATNVDANGKDGECQGGVDPDEATALGQPADVTKIFWPFGRQPSSDTAFYFGSEDTFSRAQGQATVCLIVTDSELDKADESAADFQANLQAAEQNLEAVVQLATDISGLTAAVDAHLENAKNEAWSLKSDFAAWLEPHLRVPLQRAVGALEDAARHNASAAGNPASTQHLMFRVAWVTLRLAQALVEIGDQAIMDSATAQNAMTALQSALDGLQPGDVDQNTGAPVAVPTAALADILHDASGSPQEGPASTPADDIAFPPVDAASLGAEYAFIAAAESAWASVQSEIQFAKDDLVTLSQKAAALIVAANKVDPAMVAILQGTAPPFAPAPELAWEYWNGEKWLELTVTASPNGAQNMLKSGEVTFTVPSDWELSDDGGSDRRWLRVRLKSGSFHRLRLVTWRADPDGTGDGVYNAIPVLMPRPPVLKALKLGYDHAPDWSPAARVVALNDFAWRDHSDAARWRNDEFSPFTPTGDLDPTLYLGFDGGLPAASIGLLLDAERERAGGRVVWEARIGSEWLPLTVTDDTENLTAPGRVALLHPGSPVTASHPILRASGSDVVFRNRAAAARFPAGTRIVLIDGETRIPAVVTGVDGETLTLARTLDREFVTGRLERATHARFGVPRTWIRARLTGEPELEPFNLRELYVNATWAKQVESVAGELVGSTDGSLNQALFLARRPVLPGTEIEVQELTGRRAAAELPLLERELTEAGVDPERLTVVRDDSGRATEVWVPWEERRSLLFSGPSDRHVEIDRGRGRIQFGDGRRGRVPAPGTDNVRAKSYRVGGGVRGNVGAMAIDTALSGVIVQRVFNPWAAQGGAEPESNAQALERGPLLLRHRQQAVALADYAQLAREASPLVDRAHAAIDPITGAVIVSIAERTGDARPTPSAELRRRVAQYIDLRRPVGSPSVEIVAPRYRRVGVSATIAAVSDDVAGVAHAATTAAVQQLLDSLDGGRDGRGWGFGQSVWLSDVAAVIEAVASVDSAVALSLLDGTRLVGNQVRLEPDELVVPGAIDIAVTAREA